MCVCCLLGFSVPFWSALSFLLPFCCLFIAFLLVVYVAGVVVVALVQRLRECGKIVENGPYRGEEKKMSVVVRYLFFVVDSLLLPCYVWLHFLSVVYFLFEF